MLTELPDTTMHQQNDYVQYTFSEQWFYKYLQLQHQNYPLHTLQHGGGDQIAPVFKVFDTSSKLFPSCQPAPDLSPCSSFVSNLSSRFLPLLQICPPEWLPCFRFVGNSIVYRNSKWWGSIIW